MFLVDTKIASASTRVSGPVIDPVAQAHSQNARAGFYLLLGLIAMFAAGKVILADTLDPDSFWHIQVGGEIAARGWPGALVDDLSFSSVREPWVPYSWLAELGMKKLWDVGGYRAAVAVQAVIEGLFIAMLGLCAIETTRAADGSPKYMASAIATVFGAFLSLAYLSYRPVTAVLVILTVIAWILLRDRRMNQKSRAVWIVPALTVLAVNMHFFAVLAPLWMFALVVGDLWDNSLSPAHRKNPHPSPLPEYMERGQEREPRRVGRGILLFVCTSVACLLTPMLGGTIRTMLNYSLHDVMVHSPIISEMQPFYRGTIGSIVAVLVFALIVRAILRYSKSNLGTGEIFWLLGSGVLLLDAGRMSPVFAIIAVPMLAATGPRFSDRIHAKKPVIALLAVVLIGIFARLAFSFPSSSEPISTWLNRNGLDAPHYPCAAADFVESNIQPASHRLICEFSWGGYLEWRFARRYQTLMDGRTQVFSGDFWKSVYFSSESDRRKIFESAHADAAILPVKSPFLPTLTGMGWKTVYEDEFAKVLAPPGGSNR